MLIADPKLFRSIFILSLAFLLLGLLDIHPAIEIGLFVLLMLGTGIPHGATDHLIYSILQKEEGKPQNLRMFLGTYLLSMLVYGLAWWLVPGLCLSIFLVISAYHFGQSQVLYVRWKPSDWLMAAGSVNPKLTNSSALPVTCFRRQQILTRQLISSW